MGKGHDPITPGQTVREALLTTLNEDMAELFSRIERLESMDLVEASKSANITGSWTFPSPVQSNNPATKQYVDTMVGGGGGGGSSPFINVKDYGAKGDGSTDDTSAIVAAISAAENLAIKANYRSTVTVYLPTGKYKITSQITIPSGVMIDCEGIIYNHLSDAWQFAIVVSPGGHIKRLQLWGNLRSGVKCGTTGQYANMYIGEVRMWNMGESYDPVKGHQTAMMLTGYNFTIDAIEIDGGNIGLDLNLVSDVRLDKALLFTGSTGCRITSASEHIAIGTLVIDTPNHTGLQIDSSHDIQISNCVVFLNDNEYNGSLNYAIDIGNYSASNKVNNIYMTARVQNTGGCALRLNNIKSSTINLIATNALLETGNSYPTTSGITYGTGVESSLHINAAIDTDVTTAIIGTVAGTILMSRGGALYKQDGGGGVEILSSGGSGGGNADTVDGFHASATAEPNKLLALNASGKLPASITGDADTVDGQHASAFASSTHNHDSRYVLLTDYEDADVLAKTKNVDGAGSGLDADLLDGQHASAFAGATHTHTKSSITDLETITTTPTAYSIPKAGADGKIDSGWIPSGAGGGDADTVDGFHASATAQAGKLLALNVDAKLPASITGDADTVDGQHASAFAAASHTHTKSAITDLETITTTPAASAVPKADSSGKISTGWLSTGSGSGLDADTLDGSHASAFAAASHTHSKSAITDLETITSTPTAYAVPKAGADGKIDSGWIPSGAGGGDADTVDGFHASSTAQAGKLLALDSNAKLPASITGDADTVDGQHASAFAAASHIHTKSAITDLETITTTPTANAVPKADGTGKIASGWLPSGSGGSSYDMLFCWVRRNVSGLYHIAGVMTGATLSGPTSMTANRIYYYPFTVPRDITIDMIGINVGTAASGKYISTGIYNTTVLADGTENPGSRIAYVEGLDAGTTGMKSGALSSSITLYVGELYWAAAISDGTPAIYAIAPANATSALGARSSAHDHYLYASGSGYTLPSTAGTSLNAAANTNVPAAIYLREVVS